MLRIDTYLTYRGLPPVRFYLKRRAISICIFFKKELLDIKPERL